MRVVSGLFKGKSLFFPKDSLDEIRPTKDITKEAVFNIMQFEIEGAIFCDIFAGTGAMGIEALSCNAKFVVFVDSQESSIKAIKKNLDLLEVNKNTYTIVKADASEFLSQSQKYLEGFHTLSTFDFVYADPPYSSSWYKDALKDFGACHYINKETNIMIEMEKSQESILSKDSETLWTQKGLRKYGKSFVEIIAKNN